MPLLEEGSELSLEALQAYFQAHDFSTVVARYENERASNEERQLYSRIRNYFEKAWIEQMGQISKQNNLRNFSKKAPVRCLEQAEEKLVAGTVMEILADETLCQSILDATLVSLEEPILEEIQRYAQEQGKNADALTDEELAVAVNRFSDRFLGKMVCLLEQTQQVPAILNIGKDMPAAEDFNNSVTNNFDRLDYLKKWYHAFQSFKTGEVTPEEAHAIGLETARRMWGDEYQIVVTTHLNTENVHNHMVVNSVSFKTGRKFENHVSDHYKLREISDAICRDRGKSVLKEATFYGGEKGTYWAHQKGQLTHRDIVRRDVDEAIAHCATYNSFARYLRGLGYEFRRDAYGNNPSVIAPGWTRAVRLKSLGPQYTPDAIHDRLLANHSKPELYCILYPQRKRTPLLEFEQAYREARKMDGLQLLFAIFLELLKVCAGSNLAESKALPLSPEMRAEVRKLDEYIQDHEFLCDCHIDTAEELSAFREDIDAQISKLEKQREQIRNRIRRAPETEKAQLKEQAKAITSRIAPLRKQIKQADRILERSIHMRQLLDQERQLETNEVTKERKFER